MKAEDSLVQAIARTNYDFNRKGSEDYLARRRFVKDSSDRQKRKMMREENREMEKKLGAR